jgi:aspartate/methionine/tyrosine aminotransferase
LTATNPKRPDTVMGRALATRALTVADQQETSGLPGTNITADLTAPVEGVAPEHIRSAAKDALDRGETHYTTRPGVTELREAVAKKLSASGFAVTADNTVITNGGSEALYIALQCVVEAGDTVAVVGPIAPNVVQMIEFIGGSVDQLMGDESSGFYPTAETVASSSAKSILVTTPSPLTGTALGSDQLQAIVASAADRNVEVILDQSAGNCLYESSSEPVLNDATSSHPVVIGSFSVGYGMGGWRIGFFSAPDRLMGKLRNLKQAMSICTTAVSQFAALAAIEGPDSWLEERRASFSARLSNVREALSQSGKDAIVEPSAFPSVLIGAGSGDDQGLATDLANKGVRVEPGSRFGDETAGFVRIGLDSSEEALNSGAPKIAQLLSERSNS